MFSWWQKLLIGLGVFSVCGLLLFSGYLIGAARQAALTPVAAAGDGEQAAAGPSGKKQVGTARKKLRQVGALSKQLGKIVPGGERVFGAVATTADAANKKIGVGQRTTLMAGRVANDGKKGKGGDAVPPTGAQPGAQPDASAAPPAPAGAAPLSLLTPPAPGSEVTIPGVNAGAVAGAAPGAVAPGAAAPGAAAPGAVAADVRMAEPLTMLPMATLASYRRPVPPADMPNRRPGQSPAEAAKMAQAAAPGAGPEMVFSLQVGYFANEPNARKLLKELTEKGYKTQLFGYGDDGGRVWYSIGIGDYARRDDAERAARDFRLNESKPVRVVFLPAPKPEAAKAAEAAK